MNRKTEFIEGLGDFVRASPTLRGELNDRLRMLKFVGKADGVKTILFGSGKVEKLEIDPRHKDKDLQFIEKEVMLALEDARRQIKMAVYRELEKQEKYKGSTEIMKGMFTNDHVDLIEMRRLHDEYIQREGVDLEKIKAQQESDKDDFLAKQGV